MKRAYFNRLISSIKLYDRKKWQNVLRASQFFVSDSLCITAEIFMDFEDGSFSIKIVWPYSVLMVVPNLPPEIEIGISVMKMQSLVKRDRYFVSFSATFERYCLKLHVLLVLKGFYYMPRPLVSSIEWGLYHFFHSSTLNVDSL